MISMTAPQLRRHECSIDGRVVHLRQTLADLLALLLVNGPDKYMPKEALIEMLWPNPDFEPDWAEAILFRRIHELRNRGVQIESCYRFGYRIPRWAREQRHIAEAA
jgi:DNA-binding response OmpR family regulator